MLLVSKLCAQENYIRIYKPNTNKEYRIQENKKIRIVTNDGQKIKGRFTIVDPSHIRMKNQKIPISEISKIKRNPFLETLVVNGSLYFFGNQFFFVGLFGYGIGREPIFLAGIVAGVGMVYLATKSPSILRYRSKKRNWNFEIVSNKEFLSLETESLK